MKIKGIRTSKTNYIFWERLEELELSKKFYLGGKTVVIDTKKEFQEHMGFGGAFTEAAAHTVLNSPVEVQKEIIKAYFDPKEGLNYNLGRVHIHSCDFCLENYTYVDDNDKALKTFSIDHDKKEIIPFIKACEKVAKKKIKFLASPWSPPAFMKTNKEMNYGGRLLDEYKESWANYYVKFIQEYEKNDVNIWGVSVQNEPAAQQTWTSCIYDAEDERDFVKYHLGPSLEKNGLKDKKILVWDHNRGNYLVERALKVFQDEEARKYIWGIGTHWYVSDDYSSLSKFHDLYPDKNILFTEGCVEYGIYGKEKRWENGEHYGRNIIGDFNNHSKGFLDWNLVLNEEGGPNFVKNHCEAPIMYDRVKNEIIYNVSYYYIGHFSKYIQVGAKRVQTITTTSDDKIYGVSYKNPDGSLVVVIQNEGWINNITLMVDDLGINLSLPNKSITTYVVEGKK